MGNVELRLPLIEGQRPGISGIAHGHLATRIERDLRTVGKRDDSPLSKSCPQHVRAVLLPEEKCAGCQRAGRGGGKHGGTPEPLRPEEIAAHRVVSMREGGTPQAYDT